MVREIESGLDLQRRETSALSVIEQVRDLAETIRSHRRILFIILYGSFARGDFHEESDVDLIVVGDFRERPHKAGRRPSSVLPTSRSNRSATPKKSSPNWSGAKTRSSSGPWPRASGCERSAIRIPRDSAFAGTTYPSVRGGQTLRRVQPTPPRQAGSPPDRRTVAGRGRAARP